MLVQITAIKYHIRRYTLNINIFIEKFALLYTYNDLFNTRFNQVITYNGMITAAVQLVSRVPYNGIVTAAVQLVSRVTYNGIVTAAVQLVSRVTYNGMATATVQLVARVTYNGMATAAVQLVTKVTYNGMVTAAVSVVETRLDMIVFKLLSFFSIRSRSQMLSWCGSETEINKRQL